MKRHKGLTVRQHYAIGAEIKKIQRDIETLGHILSKAYGVSSKAGKIPWGLASRLIDLRCIMDSAFANEHNKEFRTGVYYGQDILVYKEDSEDVSA